MWSTAEFLIMIVQEMPTWASICEVFDETIDEIACNPTFKGSLRQRHLKAEGHG